MFITAFADSIRVIWLVMIPFVSVFLFFSWWRNTEDALLLKGGVGLIAALGMKALKLETVTDEVGRQFP
jgi:hypothetical protein